MRIAARDFLAAFVEIWRRSFSSVEAFTPTNEWTLRTAMPMVLMQLERNDLRCVFESPFKVDAAFVSGKGEILRNWDGGYSNVHVAIEHETTNWPDDEIWKLALIRCPLKVVLFYDWDPGKGTRSPRTLPNYLDEVSSYLQRAVRHFPEVAGTEYLLVAGSRTVESYRWLPTVWLMTPTALSRTNLEPCCF